MGLKVVSGSRGKMGRLTIRTNEFCAEDWEIEETGTEEDTTNTCSEGFKEQEIGNTQLNGTINYTWDITANPWNHVADLSVGQKWSDTRLYVHSSPGAGFEDGPRFTFTLQVLSHSNSVPVDGKVTGTITFKSFGSYTLPSIESSSGVEVAA
jgi:hypothetical protein